MTTPSCRYSGLVIPAAVQAQIRERGGGAYLDDASVLWEYSPGNPPGGLVVWIAYCSKRGAVAYPVEP